MDEYIVRHLEYLATITGGVMASLAELGDLADDHEMTETGRDISRVRRKGQAFLEELRDLEVEEIED